MVGSLDYCRLYGNSLDIFWFELPAGVNNRIPVSGLRNDTGFLFARTRKCCGVFIVSSAFISLKCSLACRYSNTMCTRYLPYTLHDSSISHPLNCFLTFRNLLIISHLGALSPRMIFFPAVHEYRLFKIFSAALP